MLVSKKNNRYKRVNGQRVVSGSFYTKGTSWFSSPVCNFFENQIKTNKYVLDPFAGEGDILKFLTKKYDIICKGYDLSGEKWKINDSLIHIPNPHSAIICTNPPYLAKHSARRKGVFEKVEKYYVDHYDLYETAITRSMEVSHAGIFIIPETFLHSNFPKDKLKVVSVITENPFTDTENPICVACFDANMENGNRYAKIYIENQYICQLSTLSRNTNNIREKSILFNAPNGNIALKAVDGTDPNDRIRFERPENFYYKKENVRHSSRLLTYIHVKYLSKYKTNDLLKELNKNLEKKRQQTADLILSPFKGNNKAGRRRRRLDYALARSLIIEALDRL